MSPEEFSRLLITVKMLSAKSGEEASAYLAVGKRIVRLVLPSERLCQRCQSV